MGINKILSITEGHWFQQAGKSTCTVHVHIHVDFHVSFLHTVRLENILEQTGVQILLPFDSVRIDENAVVFVKDNNVDPQV